ncbi:MAG: hypothetical protein LBE11_02565, partial [Prevotellaceae bacterium]|nr:hypothetical protein [Prevotellaceae bacterium]
DRQIKNGNSVTEDLLNVKATKINSKGQRTGKKIDNSTRVAIDILGKYKDASVEELVTHNECFLLNFQNSKIFSITLCCFSIILVG